MGATTFINNITTYPEGIIHVTEELPVTIPGGPSPLEEDRALRQRLVCAILR